MAEASTAEARLSCSVVLAHAKAYQEWLNAFQDSVEGPDAEPD